MFIEMRPVESIFGIAYRAFVLSIDIDVLASSLELFDLIIAVNVETLEEKRRASHLRSSLETYMPRFTMSAGIFFSDLDMAINGAKGNPKCAYTDQLR